MTLKDFWESLDGAGKEALASSCESTANYLYLIALGHKKAGHQLAQRIEKATSGQVSRHDLRSDIYGPAPREAA
ncbi:transcriptional regulator [Panacagrimonas sp.]|uniref:transcriptional regulator n=1 Tax=Panacagrimonas sp. TaxID=2480088 RepID=UPI003B51B7C1